MLSIFTLSSPNPNTFYNKKKKQKTIYEREESLDSWTLEMFTQVGSMLAKLSFISWAPPLSWALCQARGSKVKVIWSLPLGFSLCGEQLCPKTVVGTEEHPGVCGGGQKGIVDEGEYELRLEEQAGVCRCTSVEEGTGLRCCTVAVHVTTAIT